MSQHGQLVWYTESPRVDHVHMLKELPELMGFERAERVDRSDEYENPPEEWREEHLGDNILATELHRLYVPKASLTVNADAAKIAMRVKNAISIGVSKHVRGRFLPNEAYIYSGKHYLVDDQRDPRIFARPTLTIGCRGYGTPDDGKEMIRLVFALPEIVEEQQRLEHLIGKLQHALYWSV